MSGDAQRLPLDMLRDLLASGQMKLGVHVRKMNSPGSPVYRYAENLWPAGTILVTSFGATALVHFYLGGAVLVAGCAWCQRAGSIEGRSILFCAPAGRRAVEGDRDRGAEPAAKAVLESELHGTRTVSRSVEHDRHRQGAVRT